MKIGVYTKALEELTPRAVREADPDRAIEDWASFAQRLGASSMQLAAAMHPSERDVPPEAQLDPVANTLDLRQPFSAARAQRVHAALRASGVEIADLGYFDNLLHEDAVIRDQKHRHLRKVFDTIGLIQIDSVNVVARSQELVLFSRLGAHPRTLLADAADDGELFEYWVHVASIVPADLYLLWRWRMEQYRTDPGRWAADLVRLGLRLKGVRLPPLDAMITRVVRLDRQLESPQTIH